MADYVADHITPADFQTRTHLEARAGNEEKKDDADDVEDDLFLHRKIVDLLHDSLEAQRCATAGEWGRGSRNEGGGVRCSAQRFREEVRCTVIGVMSGGGVGMRKLE